MSNFFISYSRADKTWAEWIAWQLEQAGYTTTLQAWDFRPSENFVIKMDQSLRNSERVIAVLSPSYIDAQCTHPEWASAFNQDPTGSSGVLLPVRVQECELKGLLNQIIYIDLLGKDEEQAIRELLDGIQRGRAKPLTKPEFPGNVPRSVTEAPVFPGRRSNKLPVVKIALASSVALALLLVLWLYPRQSWIEPPQPCSKSGEGIYHEAEEAALFGDASKDNEHAGFSGDGYVSGFGHGRTGTATTFFVNVPKAGPYQVELCYANGSRSAKTLTIELNNQFLKQTRLPSANRWNTWVTHTELLPLQPGQNTITYRKSGNDSGEVNLDFIRVRVQ